MTVLAWDGKTLAADKMGSGGGIPLTITKIHKLKLRLVTGGPLVVGLAGFAGVCDTSGEMLAWLSEGAVPKEFPESARDADTVLVLITKGRILQWTAGPYPLQIEDAQMGWGAGGDLARVAMHLGKSAKQAAELACKFEPSTCGHGIDTLTLGRAK